MSQEPSKGKWALTYHFQRDPLTRSLMCSCLNRFSPFKQAVLSGPNNLPKVPHHETITVAIKSQCESQRRDSNHIGNVMLNSKVKWLQSL